MRRFQKILRLLPIAAAFFAGPLLATNGYFPHGYGMKSKDMAGTSMGLALDSLGGATNPASMVWVGSRMDVGADLFMPQGVGGNETISMRQFSIGISWGRKF